MEWDANWVGAIGQIIGAVGAVAAAWFAYWTANKAK
jgi:hypothetical protein